jgi:Protein of unknown function (DUF2752)
MQREIFWLRNRSFSQRLITAGILLVPVVLFFIPLDWIKGQNSYKNILGNECIGCGMTRAVLSVIHFQFENAYNYNKLVIVVFPLLVYIWSKSVLKRFKKYPSFFKILKPV